MKKGFTLVELLIVIGIIAILSGIVMANFGTAKLKARDARRVSDITQLQIGLESYFQEPGNNHVYPAAISTLAGAQVPVVPTDPKTGASYSYFLNTDNKSYCLGATFENPTDPAITQNTSCTGITWCTLSTNYKVCR
jgi:prepilin-type N-terminal cleavage/methylation domain-containing protein